MYKKILFAVLCLVAATVSAWAQTGTIRGQIIDDQTGETLIGATVLIAGTTTGGATDVDGNFTIPNVQPGTYDVQASYVSYQPQAIKGVVVTAGQVTMLNVRLKSDVVGLQEVVVEAKALQNNESALLTAQKRASQVIDGISSQQISRSGDNDAAAAIRRVTGVNVEGGRYVYVRGLGDRYSKTVLNNAEIPGLDPNRNSVQMDLFPSNLLDNLIIYKTFSPELPASFAGGYVNVTTKDFPDRFTFQVYGSLGYNTNASFNNNFLSQEQGNTAFLGFDAKRREIPAEARGGVPRYAGINSQGAQQLDRISRDFSREMAPGTQSPFLNSSFSLSIGDQKEIFGKPLGLIGGFSYQRNFESYGNGKTGRYVTSGLTGDDARLNTAYDLSDARSSDQVLWGALVNASMKLNSKNKISLNLIRNQSSETNSRFQQGIYPINTGTSDFSEQYQTRALQYLERSLNSAQLKGEHAFNGEDPIKVDWLSSFTYSTQNEPDLRFFTNSFSISEGDTIYQILPSRYPEPTRYFRDMEEYNFDNKLNVTVPFKQWNGLSAKFKVGGAFVGKQREFRERIFEYTNASSLPYNGSVSDYLSDQNLGLREGSSNNFGLVIQEISDLQNSYDGSETVMAGYAMVDLPFTGKLKATLGARYERTDINLTSLQTRLPEGNIETNDVLPAANFTYEIVKDMNLRFAYGRTLARPTFRELAPFATFDFIGDFILVGNTNLKRTLIDNLDVRWEYYPGPGEIISVSGFYKNFQDPIERSVNPVASSDQNVELNYRNVPNALVYGAELEFRKSLGFISEALQNFRLGSNVTVLRSRVDISEGELSILRANDPEAESTRPLFGQAPYIVNAFATYDNEAARMNVNVTYNVSGEKLYIVSVGGTPNVFEQPRHGLDVTVTKGFGPRFSARLNAQNLLNPEFKFTQNFRGQEYIFQNSRLGQTVSLRLTYLIN